VSRRPKAKSGSNDTQNNKDDLRKNGMPQATQARSGGPFITPELLFSDLDARVAASLIAAAADVVLVLDASGVICDLAFGQEDFAAMGCTAWRGRPWMDLVTAESRPKVDDLLREPIASDLAPDATRQPPRWRHINQLTPKGEEIPLSFSVLNLPQAEGEPLSSAHKVAFARDLRPQAVLQQRLVNAQLSMEREYWRLRSVETRYRLLFQIASEAVLILDASNGKLEEANPAAHRLFGDDLRRANWTLSDSLDRDSVGAVQQMLERVRANGRSENQPVQLLDGSGEMQLSVSLFRQDNTPHFLIRLTAPFHAAATHAEQSKELFARAMENAPDAFVVTDTDSRILGVNRSFLDLGQLGSEELARGQSLDRWLGRTGVDLSVMLSNLRQHGSLRLFATTLRGEYGSTAEVEISACAVNSGDVPCFGFTIRDVGRRLGDTARSDREPPRSASQMTELVGRAPLRDIVRDTTDLIERLCIEAALQLTGDNRASAAELLGLSRQSLYIKLRRFGIGDALGEPLPPDADDDAAG
jgi:transcriptional regulator PpsR